jgi:hypothetical protein
MLRVGIVAWSISALALSSGCLVVAAGAAGAGTVAYVRGELEVVLPNTLESVDAATNRALQRLQFVKVSEAKDALSAKIIARTAQDKKIETILEKRGDTLTRVRIRVGIFGDEMISRALLDAIKGS